jgi:hypothetical protein
LYNWLGGSPDGITESGKLLEIKCPLRRKITDEVPEHYMPQLQLLMEILNLEECDFIQYKPEEITWPNPAEFMVTHVTRSREWFQEQLPVMDAFWKKVLWHREHGIEDILNKVPKQKVTRAKKVVEKEHCKIVDCDDDEIF